MKVTVDSEDLQVALNYADYALMGAKGNGALKRLKEAMEPPKCDNIVHITGINFIMCILPQGHDGKHRYEWT
jgi:hypothetical protein